MGLTPFPADSSESAIQNVFDYVERNADVVLFQHDGGVPWAELINSNGDPKLPQSLEEEIAARVAFSRRSGLVTMVAASPINASRDGIAPEWGTAFPPPGLEEASLGDPSVLDAYVEWCLILAEAYRPALFAVVIEANVYEDRREGDWPGLIDMYVGVYNTLQQRMPGVRVFMTLQLEFLRGDLTRDRQPQWDLIDNIGLTVTQDLLGLSTYPSLAATSIANFGTEYFTDAVARARQAIPAPVVIAETGYPSETVNALGRVLVSSEQDQLDYLETVIQVSQSIPVDILTWFFPFDFDLESLAPGLPPEDAEVLRQFVPMGLSDQQRFVKLSGIRWEETYLRPVDFN